jgi:hypothetical protein
MDNRRKKKLIKPSFQWKIILVFLCISCIAVLLQWIVLSRALLSIASSMPNDGDMLLHDMARIMFISMSISAAVFTPLIVSIGSLLTLRIAGPIHHMETYLQQVLDGEATGPCRIREKDEFQELCQLINACVYERGMGHAPGPVSSPEVAPEEAVERPAA